MLKRLPLLLLLLLAAPALAQLQIPRLAQPLVLDAQFTEWSSGLSLFLATSADVNHVRLGAVHHWKGPQDMSLEGHFAWTREGLAVAFRVADDEVLNDKPVDNAWQMDCVDLFLDGRSGGQGVGLWQLLCKPPVGGLPAEIGSAGQDVSGLGIRIAGRATPTGWDAEVLIPWAALPGVRPQAGSFLGVQFGLDDYDRRDGDAVQPRMMTVGGAAGLASRPDRFLRARLIDQLQFGADQPLDSLAWLRADNDLAGGDGGVALSATVGSLLAARAATVKLVVQDPAGRSSYSQTLPLSPSPAPWAGLLSASATWKPSALGDGSYRVLATVLDRSGRPLGVLEKPLVVIVNLVRNLRASVRAVDLPALSREDPFRAQGYLALFPRLERLEMALARSDQATATRMALEMQARLEVLEKGRVISGAGGLLDVLNLTAVPESQISVEFGSSTSAALTLWWGGIPLAFARVSAADSPESARAALDHSSAPFLKLTPERLTVSGRPAALEAGGPSWGGMELGEYDPAREGLLLRSDRRWIAGFSLDSLADLGQLEGVVYLPGCAPEVKTRLETWRGTRVPVLSLDEASRKTVLLAGPVGDLLARPDLEGIRVRKLSLRKFGASLRVASDKWLITTQGPSREMAVRFGELLAAGQPIALAQADEIRDLVVRAVTPAGVAPLTLEGYRLYCGDVHKHTYFSDGDCSPAAQILESIYCAEDFSVISDHNTIAGAQLVQKLLPAAGFHYPVIVGEEVTFEEHMNAYPLREVISEQLPWQEIVKSAHVQGAVIQWNHPAWSNNPFWLAHLTSGLAGTGLDAWEHCPARYEEWKAAGRLPLIVGSTDNHHCDPGSNPERTIVLAPSPAGDDVAEAIRWKYALAVDPQSPHFFLGSDVMIATVCHALAEGRSLKTQKALALRAYLEKANLARLLDTSSPVRP
ncbi:MAG: hypothetical protein GX100_06635 [candidate division WS1 bacterium]|nr:hypothetical protein [candidate division WS1 bacterium]